MELPEWLHQCASELLATEIATACRCNHWAVVLGLAPTRDGDQWCILWGSNLQEGVAAFGPTPVDAISAFDQAMNEPARPKGPPILRDGIWKRGIWIPVRDICQRCQGRLDVCRDCNGTGIAPGATHPYVKPKEKP